MVDIEGPVLCEENPSPPNASLRSPRPEDTVC